MLFGLLFFVASTLGLILLCVTYLKKQSKSAKGLSKVPGLKRLPIIGAALELVGLSNDEYYLMERKCSQLYGERFVISALGLNYIVLANPDDIEKILSSSDHVDKGRTTYKFLHPWLGKGLLTSGGQKWHRRRKMITPAFHFRILEDFLSTFNEQSQVFVEVLQKDFSNGNANDICPYLRRCTLDIIGETAMGKKLDTQRAKDAPYLLAVEKTCEVVVYRITKPIFWSDFIFSLTPYGQEYKSALKTLHDFTDNVITEKKATKKTLVKKLSRTDSSEIYWHGRRRMAFLDLLLEEQRKPENSLTDLDIREEVDTFMFTGHDTSSTSLGWTIFLLGSHPEYQGKVHEELDTIFGDDKTRPITTKDLTEMKYLELCIKESLRLFPIVPLYSRYVATDLPLDEETIITAGFEVVTSALAVHRNEKYYPNPMEYLPDRFLPENTKNRHPFAYLPFSAGPRNCVGQKFVMMEMKVILSNLFRNFKVESRDKLEDVVVLIEAVMRSRDGFRIKLFPR